MTNLLRFIASFLLLICALPLILLVLIVLAPAALPLLIVGGVFTTLAFAFALPVLFALLPLLLLFFLVRWLLTPSQPRLSS